MQVQSCSKRGVTCSSWRAAKGLASFEWEGWWSSTPSADWSINCLAAVLVTTYTSTVCVVGSLCSSSWIAWPLKEARVELPYKAGFVVLLLMKTQLANPQRPNLSRPPTMAVQPRDALYKISVDHERPADGSEFKVFIKHQQLSLQFYCQRFTTFTNISIYTSIASSFASPS